MDKGVSVIQGGMEQGGITLLRMVHSLTLRNFYFRNFPPNIFWTMVGWLTVGICNGKSGGTTVFLVASLVATVSKPEGLGGAGHLSGASQPPLTS